MKNIEYSHRRLFAALLVVVTICLCFTVNRVFALEEYVRPDDIVLTNVAVGKDAEFRSVADFSETLTMYNYFPDAGGIDGSGNREFTYATLTDGVHDTWMGLTKLNSTAKNTTGWAFIDLGQPYLLAKIDLYLLSWWQYKDIVIQVSNDEMFDETDPSTVILYSNDMDNSMNLGDPVGYNEFDNGGFLSSRFYVEIGHLPNIFEFAVTKARYVRIHSCCISSAGKDNNSVLSEIEVYAVTGGIAAPVPSIPSGDYLSIDEIALSAPYENANIYYTTDGSYPSVNSTLYTAPIQNDKIKGKFAIRAITEVDGKTSLPSDSIYTLGPKKNLVLGKVADFRALDDMSVVLPMYNYFPAAQGNTDSGILLLTTNSLTDGNKDWGWESTNATARDTLGWAFVDFGASYPVDEVGFSICGAWAALDVIVQISNDPLFESDVYTVFATASDPIVVGSKTVYDGTMVTPAAGTSNVQLSANNQVVYSNNQLTTIPFEKKNARYMRATCRTGEWNASGSILDKNTVFCEIYANYADYISDDIPMDHTLYSYAYEKCTVRYHKTKADAIAALPSVVTGYDEKGGEYEISVSDWNCENFDGDVAGKYVFSGKADTGGKVNDYYKVVPTATVVVMEKADFSELSALDAKISGITRVSGAKTYSTRTYNVFEAARSDAAAVLADLSSVQDEIDEAYDCAALAFKELRWRADKTNITALLDTVQALDLTLYTDSSKAGYSSVIDEAVAAKAAEDIEEADLQPAYDSLLAGYEKLRLIGETNLLSGTIAQAEANGYLLDNYTRFAKASYEDALLCAKKLISDKNTSPTDTAKDDIEAADTELKRVLSIMDSNLLGDGEALKDKVAALSILKDTGYTKASLAVLREELQRCNEVLGEEIFDATVAEVNDLLGRLASAESALVRVEDRVVLSEKFEAAMDMQTSPYTLQSVNLFNTALKNAAVILNDESASRRSIDDCVAAIDAAKAGLVLKGDSGALKAAVTNYEGKNYDSYLPRSVEEFNAVLAAAKAVCENEASAEVYAETLQMLDLSYSGLSVAPDKSALKEKIDRNSGKGNAETSDYALSVFNDPNASEAEVNFAAKKLDEAFAAYGAAQTGVLIATSVSALALAAVAVLYFVRKRRV